MILREKEVKVLSQLVNGYVNELAKLLQTDEEELLRILYDLQDKGLVKIKEERYQVYELTEKGEKSKDHLPERKLLDLLRIEGKIPLNKIPLDKEERNIAIGVLKRLGLVEIKDGQLVLVKEIDQFPWEPLLKAVEKGLRVDLKNLREIEKELNTKLDPKYLKELEKRGLVRKKEIVRFYVELTEKGKEVQKNLDKVTVAIDKITPEVITKALDEKQPLAEYKVEVYSTFFGGKPHYYREYINWVRKQMVKLGWEELNALEKELVPMFWCFEALFTPYDHPSRELAESFLVDTKETELPLPNDIFSRVKELHSQYFNNFLEEEAKIPILRSQVTTITAWNLYQLRDMLNERKGKYFYIGSVWRPDTVDKTHHVEFQQLEGILIDSSFAELLRELEKIFLALGFEKVKFLPAFFPFTEPSVEVYAYHPKLEWVEVAGAGMLRKQILEAFGIKYKVGAFGIGINRLAMINLGIDDIRDLYGRDLDKIRNFPLKYY